MGRGKVYELMAHDKVEGMKNRKADRTESALHSNDSSSAHLSADGSKDLA